MPETFYRTGNYGHDNTTYGGELSLFDFYGHHTMATMSKKILHDHIFDNQCKKSRELRCGNNKKNIGGN